MRAAAVVLVAVCSFLLPHQPQRALFVVLLLAAVDD